MPSSCPQPGVLPCRVSSACRSHRPHCPPQPCPAACLTCPVPGCQEPLHLGHGCERRRRPLAPATQELLPQTRPRALSFPVLAASSSSGERKRPGTGCLSQRHSPLSWPRPLFLPQGRMVEGPWLCTACPTSTRPHSGSPRDAHPSLCIPAAAPGEGCYRQDRLDCPSWTGSRNQHIPQLWLEHHLRVLGELGGHSTWGLVLPAEHGRSCMEQPQESSWGNQRLQPVAAPAQLRHCPPAPQSLQLTNRGPSAPPGSDLRAARAPRAFSHFSSFQSLEQRLLGERFLSAPGLCKAELASPRGWRLLGARAAAEPRMLPQAQASSGSGFGALEAARGSYALPGAGPATHPPHARHPGCCRPK